MRGTADPVYWGSNPHLPFLRLQFLINLRDKTYGKDPKTLIDSKTLITSNN